MNAATPAASATPTPAAQAPKTPPAKAADPVMHVLDTTAVAGVKRIHDMPVDGVIKPFEFEHGKPTPLPRAIALKFLKHDAFKLTDKDGNVLAFRRPPKQPHELQAGEQLKLGDDETVARYDELSTPALQHRVLELAGGEKFASEKPDRDAMIAFIVAAKQTVAKINKSKTADVGPDSFIPSPDFDEEAA